MTEKQFKTYNSNNTRPHQTTDSVGKFFASNSKQSHKRAIILIDGSNFYFYCRSIGIPAYPKFRIDSFFRNLVLGYKLVSKNYYIGVVRAKSGDRKSMKMMKKQMAFFDYLRKLDWQIKRGYLMEIDGIRHEKGVDVKIALDIALGAADDKYDIAFIISSDTDLLPALEEARIRGKEIKYIGFHHKPSRAMINHSDSKILLKKEDFIGFLQK